jgi:hypothetical protein
MQPELVRTTSAKPKAAAVVIDRAIVRPLCPVELVLAERGGHSVQSRYDTPAAPSAVVIVLVWRELADFSGYDEKMVAGQLSPPVLHTSASKSPAAIQDRAGALRISLSLQIEIDFGDVVAVLINCKAISGSRRSR